MKEKKMKGMPKFAFNDIIPKTNDEAMKTYLHEIPDILKLKCMKYLNMHKEDDELARSHPNDFDKSVRVLPLEIEGERYLITLSTDEKKTKDFHRFLKKGKFLFDDEFIEGVEGEDVIKVLEKRINEKLENDKKDIS